MKDIPKREERRLLKEKYEKPKKGFEKGDAKFRRGLFQQLLIARELEVEYEQNY